MARPAGRAVAGSDTRRARLSASNFPTKVGAGYAHQENEMGISTWLVATAALAAVTNVQAQEKTHAYIAPFGGYTHIRLDEGTVYQQTDTFKFDALTFGATFGFQTPVGFLAEVSRSHAVHADLFDEPGDFDLLHTAGAVGWRIPFAEGWSFTPKIGRLKWELSSDNRILLDNAGERHYDINGWDNFYELNLTRELKKNVSLGVSFRDVDQEFGHARSGVVGVSFAF
jgi:hypothetical protein